MSDLVIVPFCDDKREHRLAGDSTWNTETFFPYDDNMTVDQLIEQAYVFIMKDWGESEHFNNDAYAFAKEMSIVCTGGWVIDRNILDIINNVEFDAGSDSACYAFNRTLKSQVQNAAIKTIE